jgi:hypothetical protein
MQGYNLLTAHFSNNDRTTVEVYWCDDKGEDIQVEYTEAKEGDAAWEKLLTHITIDQLHENTYKHIREQNDAFEKQVLAIAKKRGLTTDDDRFKILADTLFSELSEAELKEHLFTYKLNLFENKIIKNSKDRTGKAAIRKAKTIIEATMGACELYQQELDKK